MEQNLKFVVVGDGRTGRTSFLISYTENKFQDDENLSFNENYKEKKEIDGKKFEITLWDVSLSDFTPF